MNENLCSNHEIHMLFEHGVKFVWQYLKWALICLLDITRESLAKWTDHYVNVFVCGNVVHVMMLWWCYDVRKSNGDAILFGEIQCKKNGILRV